MADQKIGPSSIARIAGNILSGIAANAGWSSHLPTREEADRAIELARYIAKKAQEGEAQ